MKIKQLHEFENGAVQDIAPVTIPDAVVNPDTQERLTATLERIEETVSGKVDAVEGKQLSTEDFTTALKEKLESLENYNDTEISQAVETLRSDFESILAVLKETVVITIESTIDTTGALVTLEDITAGTSTEYTYQGSPLTLYVDDGVEYRITCDASSLGLNVEQSATYTAMAANNRSISFDFRMATVEVNVTGVDSGFEVVVAVDGTEFARQTAASATYSIRKGASVTITPSSVDGYTSPSAESFTTEAGGTYSYTLAYEEVKLGVYIEDVNGKLWTSDEWDGSATANGVAVLTENCRFVMALADAYSSYCRWGGYGTEVSGIVTTTSESTATTDYAGEANTTTIINALNGTNDGYVDGAPAAEYCRAYTFPNGATGYMGAAGEWQAALDNNPAITSALSKCGGTAMSSYYWTSSQCSSSASWCMTWDVEYLDRNAKNSFNYVRAFAAI